MRLYNTGRKGSKMKLDIQHKHILNITERDKDDEGWTKVSKKLFPVLSKNMPTELIIFDKTSDEYRARLTEEGKSVVNAMKWL